MGLEPKMEYIIRMKLFIRTIHVLHNNFITQHAQESTNPSHPTFLLAGLTRCLRSKRLFVVLLAKLWCPWPTTYLPTPNRSNLPWVCENSPTPPATPKDSGSIKFCAPQGSGGAYLSKSLAQPAASHRLAFSGIL